MRGQKSILPYIESEDGDVWNVLAVHFCIDFGGRQAQIEVQSTTTHPCRWFTIYYLVDEFIGDEEVIPVKGAFYNQIMSMFEYFDENGSSV